MHDKTSDLQLFCEKFEKKTHINSADPSEFGKRIYTALIKREPIRKSVYSAVAGSTDTLDNTIHKEKLSHDAWITLLGAFEAPTENVSSSFPTYREFCKLISSNGTLCTPSDNQKKVRLYLLACAAPDNLGDILRNPEWGCCTAASDVLKAEKTAKLLKQFYNYKNNNVATELLAGDIAALLNDGIFDIGDYCGQCPQKPTERCSHTPAAIVVVQKPCKKQLSYPECGCWDASKHTMYSTIPFLADFANKTHMQLATDPRTIFKYYIVSRFAPSDKIFNDYLEEKEIWPQSALACGLKQYRKCIPVVPCDQWKKAAMLFCYATPKTAARLETALEQLFSILNSGVTVTALTSLPRGVVLAITALTFASFSQTAECLDNWRGMYGWKYNQMTCDQMEHYITQHEFSLDEKSLFAILEML